MANKSPELFSLVIEKGRDEDYLECYFDLLLFLLKDGFMAEKVNTRRERTRKIMIMSGKYVEGR